MQVGIIGSGMVGQTLGTGLIKLGHTVKIGSREAHNPKLEEWLSKNGEKASTGTFADAASFGEIIFICTLWDGTEHALKMADPANFAGKVVIDVTNPLSFGPQGPGLALGFDTSAGEQVQGWLPGAHVVKAFNIITAATMVDPSGYSDTPTMFIAGNETEAKKTVTDLLTAFGWETVDLGGIEEARLIEPLGMIWIKYFFNTKKTDHAFKLLRK